MSRVFNPPFQSQCFYEYYELIPVYLSPDGGSTTDVASAALDQFGFPIELTEKRSEIRPTLRYVEFPPALRYDPKDPSALSNARIACASFQTSIVPDYVDKFDAFSYAERSASALERRISSLPDLSSSSSSAHSDSSEQ